MTETAALNRIAGECLKLKDFDTNPVDGQVTLDEITANSPVEVVRGSGRANAEVVGVVVGNETSYLPQFNN